MRYQTKGHGRTHRDGRSSPWRIAFADAELAGHEEYLVRKIANQLGLSTADLVETKVRAREEFLRDGL